MEGALQESEMKSLAKRSTTLEEASQLHVGGAQEGDRITERGQSLVGGVPRLRHCPAEWGVVGCEVGSRELCLECWKLASLPSPSPAPPPPPPRPLPLQLRLREITSQLGGSHHPPHRALEPAPL